MRIRSSHRACGLLIALTIAGTGATAAADVVPTAPVSAEVAPPAKEADVRFRGDVLFAIHAPNGALTVGERAAAIETRIVDLANRSASVLDSLQVEDRGEETVVLGDGVVIMSVLDADALPLGRTRQQLAADHVLTLRAAFSRELRERSVQHLVLGGLFSILATLILLVVLLVLRAQVRRTTRRLEGWRGTRIRALKLQRFEILSESNALRMFVAVVRVAGWVATAVITYLYLSIVLSFFPWTRGVADRLLAYTTDKLVAGGTAVVDYLPNVVYILIAFAVARMVLTFAKSIFTAVETGAVTWRGFHRDWASQTYKLLRFLIVVVTIMVVFPLLPGSSSPAFQGISIFLGVLLSFGSSSAVSNVLGGLVITYMRPFAIGDRIQIGETVGDVLEKNLLLVRVRTIKNVEVTIPNSMALSNHIVNYTAGRDLGGLILHTGVTIGYDVPWRQVHDLLIAAARATPLLLGAPAPFVLQTALDDFYVHYQINAYTDRPSEMAAIYSDLHQSIQDHFFAAGVEIMSSHYVSARDGNAAAIPAQHRGKDYRAPSFRVELEGGDPPARK